MKLIKSQTVLYNLMYTNNFNLEALEKELLSGKYTSDDIDFITYKYVNDCAIWNYDFIDLDWVPGELHNDLESSCMPEIIEMMIRHGLNPNRVIDDHNIMQDLQYVFNGYVSADALYLLLENGGNSELVIDGEPIFEDVYSETTFAMIEQEVRSRYDSFMHLWFVLEGFRAENKNFDSPVKPFKSFDLSNLKNHRNYYYGAVPSFEYTGEFDIVIFDKNTNMEVARY